MTAPDVDVSRGGASGVNSAAGPSAGVTGAAVPAAIAVDTGGGGGVVDGTCCDDGTDFEHTVEPTGTSSFCRCSRRSAVRRVTVMLE